MTFDFSIDGKVTISMPEYIEKLLQEYKVTQTASSPAEDDLFTERDLPLLPEDRQEFMHSLVAKLLYASKRTRPDISLAVNYLSTRVNKFDEDDERKAKRILYYLNSTKDLGIILECNEKIPFIEAFADASYGVTATRNSQTGHVISIGKGPIYVSSTKQKLVTKSSTEAELVASAEIISQSKYVQNILNELHIKNQGIRIHQDNMSTIRMIQNNKPTNQQSRHIDIKYFFLRDRNARENIQIIHTPSPVMTADILTKPINGNKFKILRKLLMNSE
jgi:hypothetical protein